MERFSVRTMRRGDLPEVERIYRGHAQARRTTHQIDTFRERVAASLTGPQPVSLVGVDMGGGGGGGGIAGYLAGEVHPWEFGADPAGWIFAVGVAPEAERRGLGQALLGAAVQRFRALGVRTVRTMVRKDDVPVLRFFRGGGFQAGPYVELELSLEEGG